MGKVTAGNIFFALVLLVTQGVCLSFGGFFLTVRVDMVRELKQARDSICTVGG